ncbi:HD-GYP domain-containing protein [Angustibacter luteus]|uniref:HD domain-containing phosphohydrolase n=1 Tax=Angustibacter luteus TaxID=658456 RepID=A0ABW1JCC9_9ACTN
MRASGVGDSWRGRPLLALGVRAVQYGVPLLLGTILARVSVALLADHTTTLVAAGVGLAVAVVTSLAASRASMRLAPLAVLLQMTMIFPDRAPSRVKVARRSTSAKELRQLLASRDATAQEAAVTMLALVTALSRHDKHTRGHSERVRLFCDLLSNELGLSEGDRGRLRWVALIHDIGKLQVSALILNKPGALDDDEWTAIRAHPTAGALLAHPLAEWLGPWYSGIIQHHERFDGTGYPMGLAGEEISLAGRAVAVVDAFETMTAARSYKAARTVVAARAELTRCAGTHFDPTIVRAFLAIALPRLLWSVGPLAFLLNAPFLKWVGDGGARLADVAGATAHGAASAAGVTALVVASGSLPTAVAGTPAPAPAPTVSVVASSGLHGAGRTLTAPSRGTSTPALGHPAPTKAPTPTDAARSGRPAAKQPPAKASKKPRAATPPKAPKPKTAKPKAPKPAMAPKAKVPKAMLPKAKLPKAKLPRPTKVPKLRNHHKSERDDRAPSAPSSPQDRA